MPVLDLSYISIVIIDDGFISIHSCVPSELIPNILFFVLLGAYTLSASSAKFTFPSELVS